ncbi:MAG: hypothetical protein K0R08_2210, partial [Solimicrobium sp.]|nr:hypothetical protein [Solimicrobium sp.]
DHSWDGYHYHYENRHYLLTGFQQQKFTIKDAVGNERQCELMLDELESGIILKDIGNDNIIFEYNFPMFNSLKKNLAIAGEHATLLASLRFCNEANTAAPEENAQSTDSEETYSIYSEGLASRNIFKLRAAQRIVTAAGTDRYSQEVLVKASKFIAHMAPPEAEAAQHSQVGLMI